MQKHICVQSYLMSIRRPTTHNNGTFLGSFDRLGHPIIYSHYKDSNNGALRRNTVHPDSHQRLYELK